MADDFELVA